MDLLQQLALKLIVALIPDWIKLSVKRKLIKLYLVFMLLLFLAGGIALTVFAVRAAVETGGTTFAFGLFGFLAFVSLFFAGKILIRLRRPI